MAGEHVDMNQRYIYVVISILVSIGLSLSLAKVDGAPDQPPSINSERLSPVQLSRLLMEAEKYAHVIMQGTEADLAPVFARMYEKGINDPYVRGLLFGPSEAPDKRGFREILKGMSTIKTMFGNAYTMDDNGSSLRARVYFYDPAKISAANIRKDECKNLRISYLSQIFKWNGSSWQACCLLFEAETDGPC